MVKATLLAIVVAGMWLAPAASADSQDQAFLSFLAAHKVAVDKDTALKAAHITCVQSAAGVPDNSIQDLLRTQFATTINGAEYWIIDGARKAYCPR